MNESSIFDYLYRDAGNYKAWGSLLLEGRASETDIKALQSCLDSEEFFIAEQVGIPPLYAELWEYSGGPTEDDHVWHTFHELRPASSDESAAQPLCTVSELVARFMSVKQWDEQLSPHWDF